ncbi:cytochrome P450 [Mycena metata]|uniref:Cytochrome P450 n=1 Tax=Mycena metata TaxID=1033252 RepID=A0AAD7IB51_9AGAR|nr:cytochrome P450 [Mycena metata]
MSALSRTFMAASTQNVLLAGLVATAIGTALTSYLLAERPAAPGEVHELGGFWLPNAWSFFTRRYDFVRDNFRRTRQKLFQFRVLQHRVIASSGEDARKAFFGDKSLSLGEGYKILLGGGPDLAEINIDTEGMDQGAHFSRQLLTIMSKDRLQDVFPSLLSDVDKFIQPWGTQGSIDPFIEIFKLVFQLTVRMATCSELADDLGKVVQLSDLYLMLEKGSTPAAILLPWFPSPARKIREKATAALFGMLYHYVELRRNATVPSSDAIDVLLSDGTSTEVIVGFILRTIFAGVLNSGVNACWSLIYLGMNPTWKEKSTAEVRALLEKYSSSNSDPLHKRLASIPVTAWEEEMPVAEAVIRETLRLVMGGVALRRNLEHELRIGAQTVTRGDFLAYSLADVHLDENIYPEPVKFDPGRYEAGREEDKNTPFGYLGWGAGRHPCTGMKVAKLEMKAVMALFLAGFEYEVVDSVGRPMERMPEIDRNDLHLARPLQPCNIKFKRTEA